MVTEPDDAEDVAPAPADVPAPSAARAPGPRPVTAPVRRESAEPIPRFVEFRPGNVVSYIFGAFFTVFAVGAVITIFWAVSDGRSQAILGAAGLTALAMLSWWALLNWSPPIVSVSNGLLELSRGSRARSWDLRDPDTEITFRGRPSSRSWKAILRDDDGKPVTISARNVDPAQFTELVEHYQAVGPETEDQV